MTFRLVRAHFERSSKRAYVELRENDDDGGEMIVAAISSFRRTTILTKRSRTRDRDEGKASDAKGIYWPRY